jgi:hypothetical protein
MKWIESVQNYLKYIFVLLRAVGKCIW